MSYCSFYHPTEGRRLSWPSWQASNRDGLPACRQSPVAVLTGLSVEWLRFSRNVLPTSHWCTLLKLLHRMRWHLTVTFMWPPVRLYKI